MAFMFDTDICSKLIHRKPGHERILDRMDGRYYGDFILSAITVAELRYMIANAGNPDVKSRQVRQFLLRFAIAQFGEDAAGYYGALRVALKHNPVGPYDMLIAAHALALGAVLVTNNVREFQRVPELVVENWLISTTGSRR